MGIGGKKSLVIHMDNFAFTGGEGEFYLKVCKGGIRGCLPELMARKAREQGAGNLQRD